MVLEMVKTYDVVLKGDNMRAEVGLTFPNNAPAGQYWVKDQSGGDVIAKTAIGSAVAGQVPSTTTKLQVTVQYQLNDVNFFTGKTVQYGLFTLEVRQV
jgi:hypothetical protein